MAKQLPVDSYLQRVASSNIRAGLQYEPRVWWDVFHWPQYSGQSLLDHEVFQNTERWPIRITHIVVNSMAVEPSGNLSVPEDDERYGHAFQLAFESHNEPYPRLQTPFSVLHNVAAAASPIAAPAVSVRRFRQPLVLGQRDVLEVDLKPERPLTSPNVEYYLVSVAFSGVGMLSRRPVTLPVKFDFQASQPPYNVSNTPGAPDNGFPYTTRRVQNTLHEPLELHEVSFVERLPSPVAGVTALENPSTRHWRFNVRHRGNSSGTPWMKGPEVSQDNLLPAALWGVDVGRGFIHELADTVAGPDGKLPGWLLEPGERLAGRADLFGMLGASLIGGNIAVGVALHGYAIIG